MGPDAIWTCTEKILHLPELEPRNLRRPPAALYRLYIDARGLQTLRLNTNVDAVLNIVTETV
jgi:hypothetical protein